MYQDKKTLEATVLEPIFNITWRFYLFMLILLSIVFVGAIAWIHQLTNGLKVTGLNDRIFWGVYISNFIYFIGVSYSGTLISAVLRLTQAEWRKPITRMAEVITLIGIIVGFSMIFIDMGRIERLLVVPIAARIQSPLFWDFLSVTTYGTGSFLFLYVPLIPDIALLRDKFNERPGFSIRRHLYRILALGWHGSHEQKEKLERIISTLALVLIPVAFTCHTVIAFIFALTWRVGWHSTVFGPYFVAAAVFSGIAAIMIAMAIFRKLHHLEEYITYLHFRNLGFLLLAFCMGYTYLSLAEYITSTYRGALADLELMEELGFGTYAAYFWSFWILSLVLPTIILLISCWKYKSEKAIWASALASLLVLVGMWIKRYIIVIPALARPFVAEEWTEYSPTWVELSITIAAVAGFLIAYGVFSKLFPIISIWELMEEKETKSVETLSKTEVVIKQSNN